MRNRHFLPLLALALSPGCHRLTGYDRAAGALRHGAGLNIAGSLTLALSALAGLGGLLLVIRSIVTPERYERGQALWGGFLMLLAGAVALSVLADFRYLQRCC